MSTIKISLAVALLGLGGALLGACSTDTTHTTSTTTEDGRMGATTGDSTSVAPSVGTPTPETDAATSAGSTTPAGASGNTNAANNPGATAPTGSNGASGTTNQ